MHWTMLILNAKKIKDKKIFRLDKFLGKNLISVIDIKSKSIDFARFNAKKSMNI